MMKLRRWFVAGVLLIAAMGIHSEPVSFADLAKHAEYKDAKISPNGEYLAATAVVKGQTVLALIHLSDSKIKVISPREDDDVIDFAWASPMPCDLHGGPAQGRL
ncbi:MAG: hypothetical protein WC617_04965 [Rhodanobacter sp.]|jgi:hypothetical protein